MERKTPKSNIEVELPDGRLTTIKELMRKYDDNKDGKIGRTELGNLLTDCNEGKRPSEEEIEYFHRVADMHDGHADGTLERNDLEYAINCWKAYLQHQSEIDEAFDKYDQDKNGKLEFSDLKLMLTDLNGGTPPPDSEVSKVMQRVDAKDGHADGAVLRMDVLYAVAIWYARSQVNALDKKSACCAVS